MFSSVSSFVLTIFAILIIIIFGGSIYAFFSAVYLFIFSAGDAEKIKKAWNSIRYMILWVVLTVIFLFIFPIIFKKIRLPGYELYSANNIFLHASVLIKSLFGFSKEAVLEYQKDTSEQKQNTDTTTNDSALSPTKEPLEL
jgi:hypothetical protein